MYTGDKFSNSWDHLQSSSLSSSQILMPADPVKISRNLMPTLQGGPPPVINGATTSVNGRKKMGKKGYTPYTPYKWRSCLVLKPPHVAHSLPYPP